AAGAAVRRRTSGSRRHARHRDRRAHLRLAPFHPRPQARSTRRTPACCGRRADPPSQHPRLTLLPIGGQAFLTHPTLDLLHQPGLNGMAKAFGEIEASGEATTLTHPEWLALLLDQELRSELLLLEVLLLGRRMSTRRTVIPDIAARLRDDLVGRRGHNLLVTALELLQERGETFRGSLLDGSVLGAKPYPH